VEKIMSIVDFSGAATSFDAFNSSNINHNTQVGFSTGFYSWKTSSNFTITALSSLNNITANGVGPTGGIISTINAVDNAFNPIFSITGLNNALLGLVAPGNAALSHEAFWENVLAGATTFIMPQQAGIVAQVFGDFFNVNTGQVLNGANDVFTGNGSLNNHIAIGDAYTVAAGARLNGGNDQFVNLSGTMIGDVGIGFNFGIVKGGNDSFVGSSNPLAPTLAINLAIGDVYQNNANVAGGADSFKFTNFAAIGTIAGDVLTNAVGFVLGGNDAISVAKTSAFFVPTTITNVVGDVLASGVGTSVKGGNDSISIRDATGATIVGDVLSAGGNVTGGNDHIVFASSAPFYSGPPALAPSVLQSTLIGDALSTSAGNFVGGNDVIAVVNAYGSVVGDILSMTGAVGHAGNDTISIAWNQVNIAPLGAFNVNGDYVAMNATNFISGNDSIVLNLTLGSEIGANVYGDGLAFTGTSFVGGNDTIVLNSNRVGALSTVYGDGVAFTVSGTFHGGNDNITGSNGKDFIYGDATTVTAGIDIGGSDIINGRGGNDVIDGGLGFDAAVYSSLNQAVFVNLNGIAGSAAAPANWVEAIGQGSDQLIGIERIVGSQLGDVIIGDAVTNIFNGLRGADSLNGGGGNDVLVGGLGNDVLVGGANSDIFQFTTAPNSVSNRDVITDFNHALDTIQLDNAVFAALGAAGPLNAGFFRLGAAASDANDHIIYNQANGALFYDSNGNAAGGSVMFAVLSTKPAIAADDFVVI
jgi:Ca2+-binding RTX toxin-like protein